MFRGKKELLALLTIEEELSQKLPEKTSIFIGRN